VRHMDATTHNKKNTMGMVLGSATAPIIITEEELKCEYCKKTKHDFAKNWGTSIGNGQTLRKDIITDIKTHPWYSRAYSLQAHHLICSEAMDDDDWYEYCILFGYNINHKNNGVMLPYFMDLACQLHVPLHRGNHDKGDAGSVPYPDTIKNGLEKIIDKIKSGDFCDNPKALVDKLDKFSKRILKKLNDFRWTVTADGKDYKSAGNGCAGVRSITKKPKQPCPCDRHHAITKLNKTTVITCKTSALQIGK